MMANYVGNDRFGYRGKFSVDVFCLVLNSYTVLG